MTQTHIVIIGGSSGIGLASAARLLASGHAVTIAGRSRKRLDAALARLDGARAVVLDATDGESVRAGFAGIGRFDHLVLALGSRAGVGPFATLDPAEMRQGFEEKVFAHFLSAQAALPTLAADGSITFVSAVTAVAALPETAAIGAANAAVAALVPILAAELKPRRVNGVAPGVIDTPWWDFLAEDVKAGAFEDFAARTPVGRNGTADDVAGAIAFLIGAGYVTGQLIACDGGLHLAA